MHRSIYVAAMAALPLMAQAQTLFGPTPYLSAADIPPGFYQSGSPAFLDNFEDGPGVQGDLVASTGGRIGPGQFNGSRDSVDGDDGAIDGSGLAGSSWFSSGGSTGVKFTYAGNGPLPTAFGIVWTDGAGSITFKAFGADNAEIFSQTFVGIPDSGFSGRTAEDRFFGLTHAAGIRAIQVSNSSGGIELDHVQYGQMFAPVPEPGTWALMALGLAGIAAVARRRRS